MKISRLGRKIFLVMGLFFLLIILVLGVLNFVTAGNLLVKDLRNKQLMAFVKSAKIDIQSELERPLLVSQEVIKSLKKVE
ncbi:MAG: hypothetical protein MJB14_07835 [Spirochaetes bacterium]|nr:hypothetical protein [Spirochaetota bacterium]